MTIEIPEFIGEILKTVFNYAVSQPAGNENLINSVALACFGFVMIVAVIAGVLILAKITEDRFDDAPGWDR